MEALPVPDGSEEFHLAGLRGKLYRLLERFRELRARLGRRNRRQEIERRKEVNKHQGVFSIDPTLDVTPKTSRDRSTISSLDDDVIRQGCFGNFLRKNWKRRNKKEYAVRTESSRHPVSPAPGYSQRVDGVSCCSCFAKKSQAAIATAKANFEKIVARLKANDGADDVDSCAKADDGGKHADETLSEDRKASEDSSGTEINTTAVNEVTVKTFDVLSPKLRRFIEHMVENIALKEKKAEDRKIIGTSAEKAVRVTGVYEPTPGPSGCENDPIKTSEKRSSGRSAEQVIVIVTEKQTIRIRTLPSPNKYKIRIIEAINNSDASVSDTSSSSGEAEATKDPVSSSDSASTWCSGKHISTKEKVGEVGPGKIVAERTRHAKPKAKENSDFIVLHNTTSMIALKSKSSMTLSTLSLDAQSIRKWRPSPPTISGLGYCHRWAVLGILENIDSKFPVEFPRTNWAQYIIKRQQVSYKMQVQPGRFQIAGEGVYGSVFRCDVRISGETTDAVIKFLRKLNTRGAKTLREAKLMEMLSEKCGDFVPRFLGVVYVKPDQTYVRWGLVCEDVDDNSFGFYGNTLQGVCDLHSDLLMKERTNPTRRLPIPRRNWLYIIHDIAVGLAYIHEAGVILNDLKASNILLKSRGTLIRGSNWRVTFIDFGLASFGTRGKAFDQKDLKYWRGKCWHVAPEVFQGNLSTRKSDIYSFGILVKPIVQMFSFVRHHPLRMLCIKDDPVVRPTARVLAFELETLAKTEPKEESPP